MIINKNDRNSIRSVFGKTLAELGKTNPDIVVLDADLSCSTQTQIFAKEFPERFFNCGIAEQDMILQLLVWHLSAKFLLLQALQCLLPAELMIK